MYFGATISALIREGCVVGLWDFRSGSAKDWGSYGTNVGILSSGCRFTGPSGALRFPAVTDEVTVADVAALRLTTFSVVVVLDCTSQTATEYLVSHDSAGSGYSLGLNATQLLLTGDGVARTIAATLTGARSLGATCASGGTPIGYKDGLSLGNFSGAVTVTGAAVATEIGNWNNSGQCKSAEKAVLIANRILTPTEMAQVHAELVAARWPAKQTAIARREQGSVIGEPNLLAGYTLRPQGLLVPSHNGAFTGTLSGQAQHVNSILGDALSLGRVTGAVDLGVGNAQINPTTDSHWVEVWARPLDVAMVDTREPIIGKGLLGGYFYYANFGVLHDATNILLTWYTGGAYVTVIGPTPRNKLTHIFYLVDRALNQAFLYVDGVQYGPTAIGAIQAAVATNWVVGKCGPIPAAFGYESFGGLVVNPRIGTGVLTPAQVQARYLAGAKAIQFKTDFGYNISPTNEGGVTGQQIGGDASPFRAGDAVGRWAVETDTIDGRLCKVLTCKTAGTVYVPASYFHQATATEAAFGTFDLYGYKADASAFDANIIATVSTGITTGYGVRWAADESVVLYEYGVGNVIAGGTASHSVWHRFRVTRSITGLFTLYVDGVVVGTATDITTLTSLYMVFDMDAGDKLALGNSLGSHSLTKMFGVCTPSEG